jgi:tetratricopeptide (TPR) repeat protein
MYTKEQIYGLALNAEDIRISAASNVNSNPTQYKALLEIAIGKFEELGKILEKVDLKQNETLKSYPAWVSSHLGAAIRSRAIKEPTAELAIPQLNKAADLLMSTFEGEDLNSITGDSNNRWRLAQLGHAYQWKAIATWNGTSAPVAEVRSLFHEAITAYEKACGINTEAQREQYSTLSAAQNSNILQDVTYSTAVAHLGMAHRGLSMTFPSTYDKADEKIICEHLIASYICFFRAFQLNTHYTWAQYFIARLAYLIGLELNNFGLSHSEAGKQDKAVKYFKASGVSFRECNYFIDRSLLQDHLIAGSTDVWKFFATKKSESERKGTIWGNYLIMAGLLDKLPYDLANKQINKLNTSYFETFQSVIENNLDYFVDLVEKQNILD